MPKEIKEKKKYPYYKIWKRVMADKPKKETKEKIIKILENDGYIRGKTPEYKERFAAQLLELFAEEKQKLVKEIDKIYKKEKGIHNWLDLREKLLKEKLMPKRTKREKTMLLVLPLKSICCNSEVEDTGPSLDGTPNYVCLNCECNCGVKEVMKKEKINISKISLPGDEKERKEKLNMIARYNLEVVVDKSTKFEEEKQKAIDICLREHSFKCCQILREAKKEEFHRGWNNCEKFWEFKHKRLKNK